MWVSERSPPTRVGRCQSRPLRISFFAEKSATVPHAAGYFSRSMEERNKRVEGTKPASGGRGAKGVHAYSPAQNKNRGRGRGRGGRGSSSQRARYTPVARVKPTTPYKGTLASILSTPPLFRINIKTGLEMVISGGQTGADRGGLIAAKALGIPTGGTAPLGYKTEAGMKSLQGRETQAYTSPTPGSDLTLKREFNLKEGQCDYADRTKMVGRLMSD